MRLDSGDGIVLDTDGQQILTGNPADLYVQQVERNAENEGDGASGLGFLTILTDYGATLAWKFSVLPDLRIEIG